MTTVNPLPQRFPFTMARLERLAPPATGRETWLDSEVPGLQLRVTSNGAKTFCLLRKVMGRPVRMTLGRFPGISVEVARKLALKRLADLADGVDPQAEKRAARSEATLEQLHADWQAKYAQPHLRSAEAAAQLFARNLSSLAKRRLSEITQAEVRALHTRLGTTQQKPVLANRVLALLSALLNYAKSNGYTGPNPAEGVKRFREQSRARFMDADELRAFFAALQHEPDRTTRDFFLLALLTGARRANVLGMRWADLDLQRGLWRIPGEKSKNGEPLVVILAPPVLALLQERRALAAGSPWVLPSDLSATGHYVEPTPAWQRILARAELLRLVARIGECTGLDAETTASGQRDALDAVEAKRQEGFARRLPAGSDPMALVLAEYRTQASQCGLNPGETVMQDLRIHDLRRTLGSWQAATGASLPIIGRSLGHKQVQTTAIYARLSLDPVRAAVEKATTAMLAAVGEGTEPTKSTGPVNT